MLPVAAELLPTELLLEEERTLLLSLRVVPVELLSERKPLFTRLVAGETRSLLLKEVARSDDLYDDERFDVPDILDRREELLPEA